MELYTSHGAIISTAMLLVSDSILGKLYTYTPDGIRSSKTVNGTKTEYLLNGTQILAQKTGSDVMWFFYDSTGTRIGVQQGNVTAYYMYNLQGDVVGLADAATGKIIAKYLYDAWGKCVSVENADGYTIGTANPFRYRGYYYDNDTGLYYLQSRYYDPEVGRFINSDEFVTTDVTSLLGSNMFAYCLNNPVNMVDCAGESPANIIGGIIGGVAGAGLGILLSDQLGFTGWKKIAIVVGTTIGGAVLGALVGPQVAKIGSRVATRIGIQATKQTIKMSSKELWKGSAKHIFSKDHIKNGIMKLGNSQKSIFNKLYKIVDFYLPNAVNGSNQIHTTINGVKITIRFYVSDGKVQSIDAFTGWATRIIGKLL